MKVNGRQGEEVVSFGRAPWMIVKGDAAVTIKNTNITQARILDANGMPIAPAGLTTSVAGKTLKFPCDALYVVLE